MYPLHLPGIVFVSTGVVVPGTTARFILSPVLKSSKIKAKASEITHSQGSEQIPLIPVAGSQYSKAQKI